jgi:hypothetical protein
LVREIDGQRQRIAGWYGTQEGAAYAALNKFPDATIYGLPAEQGGYDIRDVDAWLYDAAHDDVTATTSDEELNVLAEQYLADAKAEQVHIHGDVLEYLRDTRAMKQADTV